LGLLRFDENGDWSVSSDLGCKVAEVFAASTRKTPYLSGSWQHRIRVPLDVLEDSAEIFSLDGLARKEAEPERKLLIQIFFSLDESLPTVSLNQQRTLGQFLHVLTSCDEVGFSIARRDTDKAIVFWPHYYDCLVSSDEKQAKYQPLTIFAEIHGFWRQFCAHQFLAFALEEFFAGVLDIVSPHPEGLIESQVLDELLDDDLFADLKQTVGRKCSTPAALLAALGVSRIPDSHISDSLARQFGARASLNEWAICTRASGAPATRLGRAILLLALLYGKWRGREDDDIFRRVGQHATSDLWLGTIFEWVDAWISDRLDWRTATGRLLTWLLLRHDQVKFQKRKLEASWIENINGRLTKQQDLSPSFRSSRHKNAATILQDLGLLKHGGLDDPLRLTKQGEAVLQRLRKLGAEL
jgi:hypothetical protein